MIEAITKVKYTETLANDNPIYGKMLVTQNFEEVIELTTFKGIMVAPFGVCAIINIGSHKHGKIIDFKINRYALGYCETIDGISNYYSTFQIGNGNEFFQVDAYFDEENKLVSLVVSEWESVSDYVDGDEAYKVYRSEEDFVIYSTYLS